MYFFRKSGYEKCIFFQKVAIFFVYLHFEKQSEICIEIL